MTKVHGLVSILLFMLTQMVALTTLFLVSTGLGVFYAAYLILACLAVVYFYCAKCPVRVTDCGHLIVGPVTRIFPERKQKGYTKLDYTVVATALASLILVPQIWLWHYPAFLATFWIALIAAAVEINRYVCTRCENIHCIACKASKPGIP